MPKINPKEIEKQIVADWNEDKNTPVTTYLKQLGVKGTAEHIGNKQFSPTSSWAIYNTQKSYAKTDVKIGPYKISLKSANDHILMSAKKNEALATFMNVAETLYKNDIPNIVNDVIEGMNGLVTKGVSPLTITKAKKLGDPVIQGVEGKHRNLVELIERAFKDPVFNTYFIQEVLTGNLKFGKNSDAAATHILYITHKPIIHSLDDMGHISEIARSVDIRVDFKSVQKIQGSEVGKYRFWSVLQMISKELIKDSVMYEGSFMSKSYSYVLSILSDIKQSILSWSDLFRFLGIEPEITITVR